MTAFSVTYAFTGSVLTVTSGAANITEGAVTPNTNMGASAVNTSYASAPFLQTGTTAAGSTSAAAAVSGGFYDSITLTPDAGYAMDLSSIAFNGAKGGSGTRGFVVRSSMDNYTADLFSGDFATQRPNWTAYSLDLSSYAPQTDPVTFRFYIYTPAAFQNVDFDDIVISGDISPVRTSNFFAMF